MTALLPTLGLLAAALAWVTVAADDMARLRERRAYLRAMRGAS